MTTTAAAAGREAHVDTAAVGGQAARRAGLGFSWVPQIIQLRGMIESGHEAGRGASVIQSNILSFQRKPFSALILYTTQQCDT